MKQNTRFGFEISFILMAMVTIASAESTKSQESNASGWSKNLHLSHFIPKDEQLFDASSYKVSRDVLKGKYVGIYFSASWCGPCRPFTVELRSFRKAFRDKFEVVFISLDKEHAGSAKPNLAKKELYMKLSKMDWYTIHIGYEDAIDLYKDTKKRGIPNVIVFSPDGKYVTNKGRTDIHFRPLTTMGTWAKLAKLNGKETGIGDKVKSGK